MEQQRPRSGLPRARLRRHDGRSAPPQSVVPSGWVLPDPATADEDGVVGVGADLAPGTLVEAYRLGIFPWPHPGMPMPWFSPDPRGVLGLDELRVSRSLRQRLRRCGWVTTIDHAFDEVISGCAEPRDEDGTWISGSMVRAYRRLHELGWVHSLEVWDGQRLVGGLYGVLLGGIFTGESMFHRAPDASKVALVDLAARMSEAGGRLIDVQLLTPHLARLGAREVPRAQFLEMLRQHRDDDVRLLLGPLPAARLAPAPAAERWNH